MKVEGTGPDGVNPAALGPRLPILDPGGHGLAATKTGKGLSRRDAHKRRTRTTLRDAALDLFLAQGYDATTTDQVAAKAGVSTRTFFRYFDSKDEVLFSGQRSWSGKVADMVKQQPAELRPMDAMCETLVELANGVSRDALIRFERIVNSSVTLLGRSVNQQLENVDRIADGLAARKNLPAPDDECRIMASVGLMLYRQAVTVVRDGNSKSSLESLIREQFAILETIYGRVVAEREAG
jgi:AcrR family transcriptional regulator